MDDIDVQKLIIRMVEDDDEPGVDDIIKITSPPATVINKIPIPLSIINTTPQPLVKTNNQISCDALLASDDSDDCSEPESDNGSKNVTDIIKPPQDKDVNLLNVDITDVDMSNIDVNKAFEAHINEPFDGFNKAFEAHMNKPFDGFNNTFETHMNEPFDGFNEAFEAHMNEPFDDFVDPIYDSQPEHSLWDNDSNDFNIIDIEQPITSVQHTSVDSQPINTSSCMVQYPRLTSGETKIITDMKRKLYYDKSGKIISTKGNANRQYIRQAIHKIVKNRTHNDFLLSQQKMNECSFVVNIITERYFNLSVEDEFEIQYETYTFKGTTYPRPRIYANVKEKKKQFVLAPHKRAIKTRTYKYMIDLIIFLHNSKI